MKLNFYTDCGFKALYSPRARCSLPIIRPKPNAEAQGLCYSEMLTCVCFAFAEKTCDY